MTDRRPVLLTVSGRIPDGLDDAVSARTRPRADYRVMAERFDADVVDVDRALASTGRTGRALFKLGGAGVLLGWFCFRQRKNYEVIVTDGEQVGIPLALLTRPLGRRRRGARHMMIVHIVSVSKKAALIRWTRIAPLIDRYIVYCTKQADFIHERFDVERDRIVVSTFMVDTEFFDPDTVEAPPRQMICSAGLERRDYPTLMEAVTGLPVQVVIAAASPWSVRDDSTEGRDLPDNVEVLKLDLDALRTLYAEARFVVMPLEDVDFQAGITTILEAMSMATPVVCTRTSGQTDTIVDNVNGRYVIEGGDPVALRQVIIELLDDPMAVERLGSEARRWTIEHADIERYADRLAGIVDDLRRSG